MKTGIIYLATCKNTGKQYIGQTIRELRQRKIRHFSDSKRTKKSAFACAIQKYGKDAFVWEILETCIEKNLNDRESHWISALDTLSPNGYNLKTGGRRCKHSKESREKISKARKGCTTWNKGKIGIYTDEIRKQISEKLTGRKMTKEQIEKWKKSRKGYRHSEATKAKMRETWKRRKGEI